YADTANYAINAGASTTSNFADSSDASAYAHEAGHATYADTAQYTIGGGSAAYADSAGHLVVPDSMEATVNTPLNALLWLKNNGTGSGIMVDRAGAIGVYVMNAGNQGYHVYQAGKVGYGVQYADVGFRSYDADTGIYAKGTQLAGYFEGDVKVASNITSDEFYKGVVTADSSLVTKKYVDDQVGTATYADSAGVAANAHALQGKDTTALDSRYVNEGQVNSVTGTMIQDGAVTGADFAKPCTLSASSASPILVVQNTGAGDAGYFQGNVKVASNITSDEFYKGVVTADSALVTKKYVDDQAGTATYADSAGVAANAHALQGKDTTALDARWVNNSIPDTILVNTTTGPALHVRTFLNSTGSTYGFSSYTRNINTGVVYGLYSDCENTSSGNVYGGFFKALSSGTGTHFGVYARGEGSSHNFTYGIKSYGKNTSSGNAYGGYFETTSDGSGTHFGVYAESDSFGIYAKSTSGTGNYAGYFDGNVKVASNITSDDFYRSSVTADSALMTKKYIDQQTTTAANTGYHAPTLTVSMSPDSTGDWVCDGTADDVEIQAALDQINTLGGGVVYVKQGTYNLSGNLTPYSNTTLMGTGPGTVLNRTTATAINVNNKTRVVIENLRITGSCTQGIQFYDATDGEIKQCWIDNSGINGIIITGSGGVNNSHYNVIANNICSGSVTYGINIHGYENIIQGNNCRNAASSCIYLNGAESNVVVGNVVDGGTSGAGISLVSNSMDNTITGNTLIKGRLYLHSSTWNTVSSNTVFQHQIYIYDSDWNSVVGNVVRGCTVGAGVHLGGGSDFNTISNNICCYNHNSSGIYLCASSNNTVTDNVCADNGLRGIVITGDSDYNVVNDNRCVNNTSTGIMVSSPNCDENVVQNNMLKGNGTSYSDAGTNTRDDDAGATGGVGGHITGGTANYE
ncbi:right-handed parallel beta-helix repeat-containing protein, partial [candidate division WOR-3 bacterium]|nr:right-handed parallel beta-helix repeat-containing protein [candidate division WOR-3 bacterium]